MPAQEVLDGVVAGGQLGGPVDVALELEPVQDLLLDAHELAARPHGDGVPLVGLGAELVGLHRPPAEPHRFLDQRTLGVGARRVLVQPVGAAGGGRGGAEVDGLAHPPEVLAVLSQLHT